jgi:hypothetical protein
MHEIVSKRLGKAQLSLVAWSIGIIPAARPSDRRTAYYRSPHHRRRCAGSRGLGARAASGGGLSDNYFGIFIDTVTDDSRMGYRVCKRCEARLAKMKGVKAASSTPSPYARRFGFRA